MIGEDSFDGDFDKSALTEFLAQQKSEELPQDPLEIVQGFDVNKAFEKAPVLAEFNKLVARLKTDGIGQTSDEKQRNLRQLTDACHRVKQAGLWDSLPPSFIDTIKNLLLSGK